MANLWDDVKSFIQKTTDKASERFDTETTLWKMHRSIVTLQKEVETQKFELGKKTYDQLKAEPGTDISKKSDVTELVSKIDDLIKQIDEKQKEYDVFKTENEEKRTDTPQEETSAEVEVEVELTPVTPKKTATTKSTKKSEKNEKAE
ncbi:hypothetical protein KAH55_14510 [bacterium]|nr:hypothetical protein [bacterium]